MTTKHIQHKIISLSIILCFVFFANTSFGASFQSLEQSAGRLANADAGTTTNTDDAAIEFYNPAAMPLVKHTTISVSGVGVFANISMHNPIATDYAGNRISGKKSGPHSAAFIPALHFVQPINNKFAWGAGFTVPYGLETIYDSNSIARYFATKSFIDTFNFALSGGYRLTDKLSAGAGVDVQEMNAELNQAVDAQTITKALFPFIPAYQFKNDVFYKNKGSDWSAGFHFGLLYLISPNTRVGFAYHSAVHHHMHGNSTVSGIPNDISLQYAAIIAHLVNSKINSNITIPAFATISIEHDVNARWSLMADAQFTNWKTLKALTLDFSGPATPGPQTVTLKYRNAWRFSVGQSYIFNSKLTLKNGFAFDQSPTNSTYRTARIPGSNRYWATLGINYAVTPNFSCDLGYAFILFENSHIHQINAQFPASYIDADYKGFAQLVGLQLNYTFDSANKS